MLFWVVLKQHNLCRCEHGGQALHLDEYRSRRHGVTRRDLVLPLMGLLVLAIARLSSVTLLRYRVVLLFKTRLREDTLRDGISSLGV